ncbi:hypothetical protein ACPA9J_29485 [Pseudomonas aeruginosa]
MATANRVCAWRGYGWRRTCSAACWRARCGSGGLELEGLKLTLREGEDGQWSLDGLPPGDKPSDPRKLLQFLLQDPTHLAAGQSTGGGAAGKRSAVAQRSRRDPAQFIGRWAESRCPPATPDGQPLALPPKGRIDAEDWPRSGARFYLSLPQSDWAQWLPAGLTQEWTIVRAKAGGDFLVRLARRQGATAGGTALAPRS